MTKQPFPPPTPEQKIELGMLNAQLKKKPYQFDIYLVFNKINKQKHYFPPVDLMITISKNALKARPTNMWKYFIASLRNSFPDHFADLNINENNQFKNEPTGMRDIMKRIGR